MAKVSISEAARLVGLSRQQLYRKYIDGGLLSVEKVGSKPPVIDTSELMRVFGSLAGDTGDTSKGDTTLQQVIPESDSQNKALEAEVKALRELLSDKENQLREASEREQWLRNHVGEVTGALRLLEDRSGSVERVAELENQLKKATATAAKLRGELEDERDKGFWARLLSS